MTAAGVVVVLLIAWEAGVRGGGVDPLILPAPTQIAEALYVDRGLLLDDLLVTTTEIVLGLACAISVGAAVGIAMHLWRPVRQGLHPLVIGSQAVPVPVIAPLLLFALGFGLAPKVVVVGLVAFFPVAIGLYDGLRAVDRDQRKLLRSMRASRWQTLRLLELPSALPGTFTGLKLAAAVSVIGAVFAEWLGSSAGLGHGLLIAGGQLETARAFAAAFLLFVLAIALYGAFALAERRVVSWAPRSNPGGP